MIYISQSVINVDYTYYISVMIELESVAYYIHCVIFYGVISIHYFLQTNPGSDFFLLYISSFLHAATISRPSRFSERDINQFNRYGKNEKHIVFTNVNSS